jgi:hypothetical protein
MSPIVPGDRTRQPAANVYLRYLSLVPAAIVVAALYFGRPVLLPLAVSVLFAFALAPLVGRLRRIGTGPSCRSGAAVLAMGVTTAVGCTSTRSIELAGNAALPTNLIERSAPSAARRWMAA